MSQVGTIFTDDAGDMAGGIRSLKVRQAFRLVENEEPAAEGSDPAKWPAYKVQAKAADGEFVEIGAAWQKSKTDDRGRLDYLSISLTDPDLPEWCRNLAAFPGNNPGEYRVVT